MGHMDNVRRTQLQMTVDEIKRLENHVEFYTYHLMSVMVKAALNEGMSQREAAQLLRLSKSKVNRMARDPLGIVVGIGDPFKNVDRAIEEHLLGEQREAIWAAAGAYEDARLTTEGVQLEPRGPRGDAGPGPTNFGGTNGPPSAELS